MRVLALDFDGVISDSAPEAFAVALRTYSALRPGSALEADAAALRAVGAPPLERVRGARLYAPFLELMPLGNRAEDYAVVLSALEHGHDVPDQAAYDALHEACDPGWLGDFHRRFYAERDRVSEADPEGWRGLMAAYDAVPGLLRRHSGATRLAIATAKDRRSVEALLAFYGIADLFSAERVLDKETGVSKQAHLSHLQHHFDVPYEDITFVDDKVNHLDRVAHLGVRPVLAAWGYNGARERRLASERGYAVCTLEGFEKTLWG